MIKEERLKCLHVEKRGWEEGGGKNGTSAVQDAKDATLSAECHATNISLIYDLYNYIKIMKSRNNRKGCK